MTELDTYLEQTRRCLESKLYYPALAMALALPDICASLAGLPGKEARYKKWLESNGFRLAVPHEWVWRVRCAFLHDASPLLGDAPRRDKGRIELFEHPPGPLHTTRWEQGKGKFGTVIVEVEDLVGSLLDAAGRWAANNGPLLEQKAQANELLVIRRDAGD